MNNVDDKCLNANIFTSKHPVRIHFIATSRNQKASKFFQLITQAANI